MLKEVKVGGGDDAVEASWSRGGEKEKRNGKSPAGQPTKRARPLLHVRRLEALRTPCKAELPLQADGHGIAGTVSTRPPPKDVHAINAGRLAARALASRPPMQEPHMRKRGPAMKKRVTRCSNK